MQKLWKKGASVKTFLNEQNLPLFKNSSLKTKHPWLFKKIIKEKSKTIAQN